MNLHPANDPDDLRLSAEVRLKEKTASNEPQTEADQLRLQHELQVHQIELEMQNQELCAARVEIEASLKRYTELFDFAPVCYLNLAPDGTIVDVNRACASLLGICRDRLVGTDFGRFLVENDQPALADILVKIFSAGARISTDLTVLIDDQSTLFVRFEASVSQDGKQCFVVLVDLTERKRNEEQLQLSDCLLKSVEKDLLRQQKILERIAEAAQLNEVLHDLVEIIEAELPSVSCSFLLLDADGIHLHVGSGGKLPKTYNDAIEGIAIGPRVGSCGTAVFRGESVFVSDIASDPLWIDFRDLALSNGLRACWSVPIRSRKSRVKKILGTFAVYSSEVGLPDERLSTLISRIEYLACIAIENSQTTQSLHVSEARFRRFVENSPDAFLLHQSDGTIIDINDRGCAQLGYSRDELIGLTPYAFDIEMTPEKMESLFKLLNQGQRPIFETHHRCKNGTVIPVEVHLSPVETTGELQVLSTVRDVSARKQIEEELRAKHELLEETQELAHLGSFEWNVKTNQLTWSDELYRIYGYAPQEIEMSIETFFGHLHPDDLSFARAQIHQACLNGSAFSMEERILRRDGSIHTLDSRGRVICDDSGQPARIIGACIDITERKRFESELQASQRFVRSIAEASPLSIFVFDLPQRKIIYNKSRILQELGYDPSEKDSMEWEQLTALMYPDDLANFPDHVAEWESLADGEVLNSEFRLKDAHGAWHWFASRDTPFSRNDEGRVIQIIGTAQEITESKRSEAALRESEERYRLLVELLPIAVFIDINDSIEFCNKASLELFGATDSDQILAKARLN